VTRQGTNTVAEMWRFNGSQNGGRPPSSIFKIHFLTVGALVRRILLHRTKFRKARSNRCGDIAIFVIFKMAASAILDYKKIEFLWSIRCTGPTYVGLPYFTRISQTVQ